MPYPLTDERRRVVLTLLERALGEAPGILAEEAAGHAWAPVVRLTLDRALPDGGNTVIVKSRRVEGAGHGGPAHLRREHAGLMAAPAAVRPRVLGFDDAAGVIVTSDLGRWPTLEAVLREEDADAATRAMVELGRTVGRLHAATSLAPQDGLACDGRSVFGTDVDWPSVEMACDEYGFPDARVARHDLAALWKRLDSAAPFAGLVHADLTPTNALVTPDGVKLVDFEGASRGYLGLDAACLYYPFPTYSAHWATAPDEVIREVDRAYRDVLAPALAAGAAAGLDDMLAIGAAAILVLRVQRLGKLVEPDQPPGERWRRRSQLVHQIRVFERLAACPLPALAGWFSSLADAMTARWVDATLPPPPLFPAFRS